METSKILKYWNKFCVSMLGIFKKFKGRNRYKNMVLKGIAYTPNLGFDKQGQKLMPNGFDLAEFVNKGCIKYQHALGKNGMDIIGSPTVVRVTENNELYIEAELYADSPLARNVYDLATMLEEGKSNQRLGFAVVGKVLEYDKNDERVVTKAKITNVYITPNPACLGTEVQVVR